MYSNHESEQEILCSNPTSESQQEIINAINLFGPEGNLCFNESVTLTFNGLIEEETFCLAINRLIQRHDALRTTFSQDGHEFYLHKHLPAKIELINYCQISDADKQVKIQEQKAVNTEFDITHGPLVKASIIKLQHKHIVVFSVHHIICDGWSYAVFLEDLAKIYTGLTSGTHMGLPEPHYYIDYLHSISTAQHIQKLEQDYKYWLNLYTKIPSPLELPADNPPQAIRSLQSDLIEYPFNLDTCNNIRALAQQQNCSLVVVLLAAFASLIYKISNQRDIVIALPAAGQAIEGWYRVIGHCVNTLPILCQVDPEASFKQFLHSFKTTFLDSCDHQSISLGGLLKELNIKRDSARLPLASLMFNLDQDMEKFNFSQLETRVHPNGRAFENFELFLNVVEKESGFLLQWQYNTALFKQASIEAWAKAYHHLLQQMWEQPESPIDSFKLGLNQDSNHHRIQAVQNTNTEESEQSLIQQLITKPHAKADKLAIIYDNNHLNYRQLNEQSNQLANFLIEKDIKPRGLIGICMHRSIELIPTLLAIWKCGCAYVPLDPTFPKERLDYVTNVSNLKTIICHSELAGLISPQPDLNILCTDQYANQVNRQSTNLPLVDFDPETLAYVIFTSGSTGKPKGVMVSQRAAANFIGSMAKRPGMKSDDRLLAITTLSFDISVLELILPLWVGGTVIIASAEQSKNATDLIALIESHEISIMQATPSTWKMLLNSGWQGCKAMKLLCGGETFPQPLAKTLFPCVSEIWNMYGPTETTVWSTCFRVDNPNEPILIGDPIKNTQCYILGQNMELLPDNFSGELCIGGRGLSSGYLNQTELSDERFISIPINDVPTRIYRTGDKARWNHENQLEIFGRMDDQVKIRGYRIELGEIESVLSEFPEIQENAVVVSSNDTDKKIIAYYTSHHVISDDYKRLREHLKRNLPDYMLPVSFVSLELLPKLPNGKIDRKSLTGLKTESQLKPSLSQVQGEQEKTILSIWQQVLDRQDIGRYDSFFEMGGHSLLIGQVINQVQAKMDVQLTYRDVYLTPTIESLAKHIKQSQSHAQELIIPVISDSNTTPLSFAQQRLWYMEKLSNVKTLYNLPTAFRMHGTLNKDALLNSFSDLISRQQTLRTIIVENEGKPEQQVIQNFEYQLEQIDLQDIQDQESLLTKKILQLSNTEFQLGQFPLFRAALFILNEDEHVIFFVAHHIIFDGWSFDIFLHELTHQYCFHAGFSTEKQPPLAFQYTDYSAWLFDWSKGEEFQQKLNYWLNNLQGNLPILALITDKPRPEVESQQGDVVYFELENSLLNSLEIIAKKQDVSIFMIFLACYSVLLHKYTQQDDIIVGVPMADRIRHGTEKLVGLFVNTMVLRFQIDPIMPFNTFLQLVKEQCLSGYENQDAPFEKLVEKLVTDRNTSRPPLYQTSITYQDVTNREVEMGDIKLNQVEIPQNVSALDLEIWLKRTDSKLFGGIVFTTTLFNKDTIVQLKNHFIALLHDIPAILDRSIANIQFLNQSDVRLLHDLGRGNKKSWDNSEALATLFNQTFITYSEKIAVVSGEHSLRYSEINDASNQFANFLVSQDIKPGDFVGVSIDRSPMLLIVLIGIFKSGAAYIPLDPEFPPNRLEYMVKDSKLSCVVTQKSHQEKFSHVDKNLVLEDINKNLEKQNNQQPQIVIDDCSPAYVIYTSGSTGKPKGVVAPQKAVINFLLSMKECPGLSEHDVLLAITTLSFDISVLELFLPLLVGGKIILATSSEAANSNELQQLLSNHQVTAMQATPSTWRMLTSSSWQGQQKLKALCGGEAMPQDLMEILLPKCGELWNMYGPTETTVWSACRKITDTNQPAAIIGQPIANTQLYILDRWLQPVPRGVAGELFIGGAGLSNGYLYQNKLTDKTFITNPFDETDTLYRTGDRMRYRLDNNCEFLGRIDDQLKVRGFRIETGEIESVMRRHQQIQDCAIVVKEQRTGDARLIAYVVWVNNSLTQTELRRYLRDWLPTYMIPQNVIDMADLPRTPSGKLDKNNLPDIFANIRHDTSYSAAQSSEQQWLAELWKSLIGIEKVGLGDNFFDLGGHSLLSMQAIHQIYKKTGVSLNPRELLLENLEQLAERITLTDDKPQQHVKKNSWQTKIKALFGSNRK